MEAVRERRDHLRKRERVLERFKKKRVRESLAEEGAEREKECICIYIYIYILF